MSETEQIEEFLAGSPHAVVGASRDSSKIGHRVFQAYRQFGLPAYPVNPHTAAVAGVACYPDLAALPETVHGISVITPPEVAVSIVNDADEVGIRHIWFQPGAESPAAVARAQQLGMNVIFGGACLLVVLSYRRR